MLVDFTLLQGPDDLHVFLDCDKALTELLVEGSHDVLFMRHEIPKKNGKGVREIWEVRGDRIGDVYKSLARKLDRFIRSRWPDFPHPAAHGYIRDRSTLTNAREHIGANTVLKADIKSFFRSINSAKVIALFDRLGLSHNGARALAALVVREDHLPLGLPTSPILANAVCHRLDGRLAALVPGGHYTRFADDLSFSGPSLPSKAVVQAELKVDGFDLAETKWRLARTGRGLFVTGLSLEDRLKPRIPKATKRRLRQDLYHADKWGLDSHLGARGYASLQSGINKIDGLIRYIRGVERDFGLDCHAKWQRILKKTEAEVSYASEGNLAARNVLFVVDESVVAAPTGPVLIVALVVVEDIDLVRTTLDSFRKRLAHNPFGSTDKKVLSTKGL